MCIIMRNFGRLTTRTCLVVENGWGSRLGKYFMFFSGMVSYEYLVKEILTLNHKKALLRIERNGSPKKWVSRLLADNDIQEKRVSPYDYVHIPSRLGAIKSGKWCKCWYTAGAAYWRGFFFFRGVWGGRSGLKCLEIITFFWSSQVSFSQAIEAAKDDPESDRFLFC
jgi:hypothetical protein